MDLKLLLVFGIAVIAVTANRYEYLDMDDDADDEKDEEIDNDVSEEIENDELPANEKEGINMIGENIICRCYPIKGAKNAKKHKAKEAPKITSATTDDQKIAVLHKYLLKNYRQIKWNNCWCSDKKTKDNLVMALLRKAQIKIKEMIEVKKMSKAKVEEGRKAIVSALVKEITKGNLLPKKWLPILPEILHYGLRTRYGFTLGLHAMSLFNVNSSV